MARMIPPLVDKGNTNPGEFEVFARLRDDPISKDWIILHSLDIAEHCRQLAGEVDFLVMIPGKGILVLEVKACSHIRRQHGLWLYGLGSSPDPRGPFKQASEGMHSIRKRLAARRPDLSPIPFWSAVVFPHLRFALESGEWHPWQVIDSRAFRGQSLAYAVEAVLDSARTYLASTHRAPWFHPQSAQPYPEQCVEIANMLRGDFEVLESPASRSSRVERELRFFTREQAMALDAMEANPRVVFQGPAGTGKTVLALEAARRAKIAGRKAMVVCFNRLLASRLQEEAMSLKPEVTCWTLHGLMAQVVGELPGDPSQSYWTHDLPAMATQSVSEHNSTTRVDELIVDESQDVLRGNYLGFLDCILHQGLAAGRWRFFGDFERQAIFEGSNLSLHEFCEFTHAHPAIYSLRVNCRNTPRVAALMRLLAGLDPDYAAVRRPDDGIEPELLFWDTRISQEQLLSDTLDRMLEEGFSNNDIVVLSPLARESCASRLTGTWSRSLVPYDVQEVSKVRYCSVAAFKGLESPAIVVTDLDYRKAAEMSRTLYVAISRSTGRFVAIGSVESKLAALQLLTSIKSHTLG